VLYVVATPIGNPEDLSVRAVRVLREANLIACEDTRRTGKLLATHGIRTRTLSYFQYNEERRIPELLAHLKAGETVALVTDAGTPAISDPGYRLVRAALDAGISVRAVPGPSAVIAALSIAGLPTDRFVFEGFLPAKSGERKRRLDYIRHESRTIIFYEAARRLVDTLEAMAEILTGDREAVVVREITKTYEETQRGTLAGLIEHYKAHAPLGEIAIVVAGAVDCPPAQASNALDEAAAMDLLRNAGLSLKDASEVLAKITGASRRDIYQRALRPRA
jgi:16S rRNA (cytidine1402-2'-O)-methyltransferase